MTTIANNTKPYAPPLSTRQPDRTERRARSASGGAAVDEGAGPFVALISATRLEMGRSLGLRSVDRGLDAQMFEPVPVDPHAQRQSQAREELTRPSRRDARSLRLEQSLPAADPQAGVGLTPSVTARAADDAPTVRTGSETSTADQTLTGPRSTTGVNVSQASASPVGSSKQPGIQDARPAANAPTSIVTARPAASGVNATSPAAGASGAGGNSGENAGAARQVGQVLRAGAGEEVASARAATATPDSARAQEGDPRGNKNVLRQGFSRKADSRGSERGKPRVSEPTPFDELVRSIRLRTGPRFSTARLRLDPPELGRMQVDVELTGSQLSLNIRTESAEAARRVQHRVNELKAALEHHGIYIDGVDVRFDLDKPGVPGGASYSSQRNAEGRAGNDSSLPGGSGRTRSHERVSDRSGAGSEIEAGRFWDGRAWFGVSHGRVDIRA